MPVIFFLMFFFINFFYILHIQQTYLLHRLVRLQRNIRDVSVHHQREQIQDQVGVSDKVQ